ncbi:Magnesium transporter [Lachancea thermotolerans]|uniref:Magnesium transporter n=1 Tax=Lachancea thermotolerans (strain ATCC 56472 / CBS 6340 / NRRL Y-8284) TaxID=559295 RepID=C5DG28_LACTC|nr:KLTH0D01936p [Lachancea thermotolerans CBS 6340]CAR22370.1 KLTH0D01936p [Lachancea thermotolerans CBS 6340]
MIWSRLRPFRLLAKPFLRSRRLYHRLLPEQNSGILSLKPITPNDAFVSCTLFNKNGAVTAVSQKFPKWAFLKDHNLYPRDLRKIDTTSVDVIPSIVVKPTCILINLLHIKALIQHDCVFVFDTSNSEAAMKLGVLMYDLESKLSTNPNAHMAQLYEHRALESILMNVMTSLETEYKQHYSICGIILKDLEDEISRDKLRDLLIKSKNLTSYYKKSLLIRDVLDELLDSDEDLAAMYLGEHKNENDDFADLEMLLETYYKQCDEYVQQSETLLQDIRSTEEIVNIILDANRNALMLFELKVTIYTLGFTIATLVPAFYGMNLKNFIEDSPLGFGCVVGFSVIAALCVTWSNFKALSSVKRLTMMNNHTGVNTARHAANARHELNQEAPILWKKWASSLRTVWLGSNHPVRNGKHRDLIWKWLVDDNKK